MNELFLLGIVYQILLFQQTPQILLRLALTDSGKTRKFSLIGKLILMSAVVVKLMLF